jgi:hypothetical protein
MRRDTRLKMIEAQLKEIDGARAKALDDMADLINPRDMVSAVDALIKLHTAERDLYDESSFGDTDLGDVDAADLMGNE